MKKVPTATCALKIDRLSPLNECTLQVSFTYMKSAVPNKNGKISTNYQKIDEIGFIRIFQNQIRTIIDKSVKYL